MKYKWFPTQENYNKKTLQKQVDKLNQDILLIQKEILAVENKSKIINKKRRFFNNLINILAKGQKCSIIQIIHKS